MGAQILSVTVPSILHGRSLDETKSLKIAVILNRHGHHTDFTHYITSELPGEGTGDSKDDNEPTRELIKNNDNNDPPVVWETFDGIIRVTVF